MNGLVVNIVCSAAFGYLLYRTNRARFDVIFLWALFFVSSCLAFFFDPRTIPGFKSQVKYIDHYEFVLYGLFILYSLSPLFTLAKKRYSEIAIDKIVISKYLSNILLIAALFGVFSFVYQLPYAIVSLQKGALYIRTEVLTQDDETVLPRSILTTLAVAISSFFPFYLAFFLLCFDKPVSLLLKISLLIGSLSYVISSLCFAARDGIVFYLLLSLMLVVNFWRQLKTVYKRQLSYIFFAFSLLGLYLLYTITQSRFGKSDENLSVGTMGYVAQQPYVFTENIMKRKHPNDFYGLNLRFPLFNSLADKQHEVVRTNPYEWTFGSFLTDFYSVNGYLSLILLLISVTEFFRYHFSKISRLNRVAFLFIYILYFQFMISGLFYFRLGNLSGNIYILTVIIIFLCLRNRLIRL